MAASNKTTKGQGKEDGKLKKDKKYIVQGLNGGPQEGNYCNFDMAGKTMVWLVDNRKGSNCSNRKKNMLMLYMYILLLFMLLMPYILAIILVHIRGKENWTVVTALWTYKYVVICETDIQ